MPLCDFYYTLSNSDWSITVLSKMADAQSNTVLPLIQKNSTFMFIFIYLFIW